MLFGIFNIEKINNTMEYNNLLENLSINKKIEDISNKQKNSFILTEENGIVRGYISNIIPNTIKKRKII